MENKTTLNDIKILLKNYNAADEHFQKDVGDLLTELNEVQQLVNEIDFQLRELEG